MTYKSSNLVSGDVNFYAIDPFKLNYTEGYYYDPLLPTTSEPTVLNKAKPLLHKKHLQQIIPDGFI